MAVVTLSRQYGAGGLRAGPALAEPSDHLRRPRDRRGSGAATRDSAGGGRGEGRTGPRHRRGDRPGPGCCLPELGIAAVPELDDRSLAEATRRVILSLAETGGFVIVGRGPRLRWPAGRMPPLPLVGDLSDRIQRIMEWQNVSEREARSRCERFDAERAGYVKHFYGKDIRDSLLYDCVLNTSRLGLEASTELAVAAARRKLSLA